MTYFRFAVAPRAVVTGGMPASRAIFRMYESVNGDSRATSEGPTPARSKSSACAMAAAPAAVRASSARRYRFVSSARAFFAFPISSSFTR